MKSYRCPQGQEFTRLSEYKETMQYPGYVQYATTACKQCAQRSRCTKCAQGHRIKRYAEDAVKELQREKMEKPQVRQRYLNVRVWWNRCSAILFHRILV